MCGLAGKFLFDGGTVDPLLLTRMCDRLAARGPDDVGYHVGGGIGLGHRRLSIIDLETGAQPIPNEDRSIWVTLNGEIYNYVELREALCRRGHRFRTASDTEVIVHLYEDHGDAFVQSLRGMFAIALWDVRARTLILARDRIGKKPLYYAVIAGRGVVFGSQADAVIADPDVDRTLDAEALDSFLSLQYVPAPLAVYRAVRKLPAAHLLRCSADAVTLREYWHPPAPDEATDSGEEAWREQLLSRLSGAVGVRLRSDVPLGAFLSGGLDSSAVVALMAEQTAQPVVTCTATFDEAAHDERAQAREVADWLGCDHHEQPVQPNAPDLPMRVARAFDEPFADPAAIPNYLIAETARRHVKVALTGDGGDELFAGYWRHRRARLERHLRLALGPLAATAPHVASRLAPAGRRAGLLPLGMTPAQAYAWKHSGLVFDPALKSRLYSDGFRAATRGCDPARPFREYYDRSPASDPLGKALYVDLKTSLVDGILVKVDRTSMAHGLEVRSPLLDQAVVEFAARVPPSLKLHGRRGKHLLARAVADRLPPSVVERPKHGLTTPLARWLRHEWRELSEECLLGPAAIQRGVFERPFVESLWKTHLSGRDLYTQQLWTLIALELWHRQQA
jgi:asparagine synthase (glutamine-hydrolysing)